MLPHYLSKVLIIAVTLWLMLEFSFVKGQAQYRLTQLRPGRPLKPLVLKSGPECPFPYFPNGVAKPRQRNKMIRFTCSSGFTLVGNMYSMCEKGRWDTPIPICIRSGCQELASIEYGQISYEHGQAAGMLFCGSGYQVAGSAKTYCNGTHWDRPLGSCRETGIAVQTSCDFEVLDYCGWMNEATHDFDWKRSEGIVSPKALKTGPKYDHTTMTPLAGHFMMADSAEQFTNETARMLSPIYSSNYSVNACFQFFYHMFGDSVGTLSVYVKPISQPLDSMTHDDAYYTISGNQRNVWNEGYFDLRQQSENFQIIIEASLGMKFKSDIAIDDVSLMNGIDCHSKLEGDVVVQVSPVAPEEVPDDGGILKIDTCEDRCGKTNVSLLGNSTQNTVHCDCFEGCVETRTCCPDYAERCVFNDTLVTTSSTTVSSTTKLTTTTTILPSTSTIRITKPTTSLTTLTSTTVSSTTSSTPKSSQESSSTSTTVRTTTTKKPTNQNTIKTYNLRPRNTTKEPVVIPMVRTRMPTTASTANMPTTTETVTLKIIASLDSNVDEMAPSMVDSGDVKPNLGRVFLLSSVGVISFGFVVLLITLHIRRNSGASVLNRLKQKSMKNHFGSTEGFEDVRFLAADEHLDFTIPEDADESVAENNASNDEEREVTKNSTKKSSKKGKH
ncbi:uncharacterized protein LOC131436084 [Malaya genurostris]|uniref:uncharacterized protein LOC131436084 n=1 Tax=Malaya genurostris TaxID=325434 RepID=UPI0026F3AAA6|nr:uncharacterized protein LOC131436084 [Malaya genurostris]